MKIITVDSLKTFLDELNRKYSAKFYSKTESDSKYQTKGDYVTTGAANDTYLKKSDSIVASKLATAREINLTGDVSGMGTFDGTQALEIVTTLAKESGIIDGNISNSDSWWVKLGGKFPLLIQGGITPAMFDFNIRYPIAFSKVLHMNLTQFWNCEDDKYVPRILSFNNYSFEGIWGNIWARGDGNKRCFWLAIGI